MSGNKLTMNRILITKSKIEEAFDSIQFYGEEEQAYNNELNAIVRAFILVENLTTGGSLTTREEPEFVEYLLEFKQSAIYDLVKAEYNTDHINAEIIAAKLFRVIIANSEAIPPYTVLGYRNWTQSAKDAYQKVAAEKHGFDDDYVNATIEILGGNKGDDLDKLLTSLGRD